MANKTGNSIRGKICISKPGEIKFIKPEELDYYTNQGWVRGNINDTQKVKAKKWYNNGSTNILLEQGASVPVGFVRGMYQKRPNGFSKFKYRWYTNGIEQRRIKEGDSIPEGWYIGQAEFHKNKNREAQINKGNYHLDNKAYTEEYKELYHNVDKLKEFVFNNSNLTLSEMATRFNCSEGSVYSLLNTYDLQKYFTWYGVATENMNSGTSLIEKDIVDYIHSIYDGEVIENYRKLISPQEVDIFIPDKNIAIEYNGTYWHSHTHLQNKNYHFNKSRACEEKGIRLIHIYEWEWPSQKIKSLLKIALNSVNNKIYARNCEIRELTNKEAKDFNTANHLQGHRNAQVTYGLFYKDKLVQLMSFSKTKYNKNLKGVNDWEIIRGCPGSNNIVIGGVDKLFKHFIKEYNPDKIFSYCDFNKFDGISYEKIGMSFVGYTGPDKTWIIKGVPVKRNPSRYKELKAQADDIIWGAGSKKYMWKYANE